MDVKAVNSMSLQSFEGKSSSRRKENKNQSYPQMNAPASKEASKALKDAAIGLMLLASAMGTTSCVKEHSFSTSEANAEASAWAWSNNNNNCDCKHDTTVVHDTINNTDTIINTVIEPIYVKELPFNICDSLINQGLNVNVELDGPVPNGDNNVAFIASKALNRYDNIFYETKLDSIETNKNQLSLVTKMVDMYDPNNVKTTYMKTKVTDVPGKGIKIDRYTTGRKNDDSEPKPYEYNYAYTEIRSNGSRGNTPGYNMIYDNAGNMIWKGQYEKGQLPGTFMYGTIALDDDGQPYLDDDGNAEMIHYDFEQAKMWSDYVDWIEIPNQEYGKLD